MTIEQFDKMITELEELVQGLWKAYDKLKETKEMFNALPLSLNDLVTTNNYMVEASCNISNTMDKLERQIKYLKDRKDKEFDLDPLAEFFADSPKDYTITEADHKEFSERFSFYEKEC